MTRDGGYSYRSGAGTVGAFLTKHGRITAGDEFILRQGRFLGRPSEIRVRSEGTRAEVTRVQVGGDVALVGRGTLDVVPEVQDERPNGGCRSASRTRWF